MKISTISMPGTGLSAGLSTYVCERHSTTAPVVAHLQGTGLPIAGFAAAFAAVDVDAATGPPSRGAPV